MANMKISLTQQKLRKITSQNNVQAVKKFLEKYQHKDTMFLNDDNPLKCTPIQYSILQNKEDVERVLQQNGGNIHISNSQGQNALHLSAIYKRKQGFDLCIKKNIDFNHVDTLGNTPFHYACRAGSVEMIATLVAAKAKKIENKLNQYPIHMAIESDDIVRPYPKYHPIHSAARSNSLEVFKMEDYPIVRFIADKLPKNSTIVLDAQDSYGNTPLHLAFLNSNLDIIRQLVQRKSKFQIKNNDEMTPMDYGLTSQNSSVKSYLMDLDGWKQHGTRNF